MTIFRLEPELQLSVCNDTSAVRIIKLIVVSLQRFVLDREMALRTLCA